jgi:hypothetical protein
VNWHPHCTFTLLLELGLLVAIFEPRFILEIEIEKSLIERKGILGTCSLYTKVESIKVTNLTLDTFWIMFHGLIDFILDPPILGGL